MFKKFYLTLVLLFVPLNVTAQLFEPPIDNLFFRLTSVGGLEFIKDDSKNPASPSVCVAPPANLVSWYRGEGNANDAQGTNNGTLNGGADFAPGKVGSGFRFDAPGEELFVPASPGLDVGAGGSLTLEAWVNATSPNPGGSGYGPIFEWGNGSGVQLGRFNNGQLFANVVDTGVNNHFMFTPDNTLTTNQFQHVALTYTNATGIGTIYVNGVTVATLNLGSFTPRTNSEMRLGLRGSGDSFNGIIDEATIYNRALSQTEIQAIVNAGSAGKCVIAVCTPQPTNGVTWFKAENNGSDSLGSNDGTMLNGADFATGIIGSGFRFDADGEQLFVPASPSLNVGISGSLTLEAWVNPTSPNPGGSGEGTIIEWGHNSGVQLMRHNNGRLFANVQDAGVNNHFMFTPDNTLTINQFQHVALTYTNATGIGTLYVNGVVILSQNLGSFTPRTNNELHLGLSAGANSFNGIIDEAAIYNRALSQAEIQAIFNAGSAGKCDAPLRISPITATVAPGGTINFTATGGTAPRTFSIVTNNSGGAINPTTGVYTAGATFGADTVRVTDTTNATSDATVTVAAGCVAGEKTWDGGGATNNWSDAANWTCDLVPTPTDTIIFDGTSTKNATIDTSRAVKNLNINAGYTGTITQADATTLAFGAASSTSTNSSQAGGTFFCGSGSIISFDTVIFTQTGGQFNCQNGTIGNSPTFDLRINGGIFNAPSGTMTFGGASLLTLGAGGVFNHNNGTINATGSFLTFGIANSAATLDFYNFTIDLAENLGGVVAGSEANDKLRVAGTLNLVRGSLGTGTIEAQGAVNVSSTFLDAAGGGGFFVFGGGGSQIYTNNGGSNPRGNISINKTGGTVTAATSLILLTAQPLNITSGTLYLSNSSNLRTGALTIGANGRLVNDSSTTITLGGNLTNDGTIDLQGGGASCPQTDTILIRSSSGVQRSWTGSGLYKLVDVDVQNMGGTGTKTVFSGTNSGGNNASWVFNSGCPTALSISPSSANVPSGATQTFTATGGSPNYTFSILTNNSGATINPTTGLYTAGATANVTDTVRVTDSFGSTSEATVNVSVNSFVVTNNSDTGAGSLRQAITNANATPGIQSVSFNIAGTAPFGIFLLSDLPEITDPIIIDGTTQPGYAGSPIVKILGSLLNGLQILNGGGGSIIKGLHLSGFDSAAIRLNGGGGSIIQGNYIGRIDEISTSGNFTGIEIFLSPNNIIGGSTASERNVISGNVKGISIGLSDNTMVRGNYIGTNPAGTTAIGNFEAINLTGSRNCSIISNVISGNFSGIVVFGNFNLPVQNNPSQNNLIQNNIIGLDASGTNPLGNGLQGILIGYGATGNRLTGNRVFANGKLGIQVINGIGYDNIQPLLNDPQDADVGANHLQNYPVLTSATSTGGNTSIQGTLNSKPSSIFTLEFFSSPSCDASGNGEGETFIGSTNATTDAGGIVGFTANLPVSVASGRFVTATATDAIGNTSEFSRCQIVSQVFEISGRATHGGQPLGNVQVRLENPSGEINSRRTLTDSNGDYSFGFLPVGNYTLTVSHPNVTFTPPSRSYANLSANQTEQNFTVVQTAASLSGNVVSAAFTPNIASKKGGAKFMPPAPTGSFPMARVRLNLSGATNATVVTNDFGFYDFPNLPPGTYAVTPSKTNYVFTPPSAAVVIGSGNQKIDFEAELEVATLTGRIIYESRDGDIKAMNANGSGIVTFTNTTSRSGLRYSSPNLSPNGSRAVYARQRGNLSSQTGINTINADGSNVVTVLTGEGLSAPSFSPDGSRIAFHNGQRQLIVMNADGTNQTQITDDCAEPDWSPDSTKLVCVENPGGFSPDSKIVTVNADGTNRTIINNTGGAKFSPRWSPDGSRIAFVQQIRTPRNSSLIVMNANGTNAATLLSYTRTIYGTVSWSPDGARLALIRDKGIEARNHAPDANGADRELITVQADGQALLVIEDDFDGNNIDWGVSNSLPTPASPTPVTIQSGSISITFPNVGGTNPITTITPIAPGSAGTAPNGFAYGDFAFEISTTATFTTPPPVTICINLNTLALGSARLLPPASRPRFIHIENGTPVNITTGYDEETNVLCGQTNSFSPFVIAEEIDPNLPQITGLIVDSNGNPLSGVNVDLTGTETRQLQTDSNGIFRFVNLTANGNYNVQPGELGYLFTEYNQDFVNLTGENTIVFTGAANDFQISGRVLNTNGDPISGAIITLGGAEQSDATTDASGNYSFTNLPADGNYVLTASNGANSFAPPQIFVDALTSNIAGADFTQFAPTAASVSIGGRVSDSFGNAISRARVSMTTPSGETRYARTSSFGYYRFDEVEVGQTYVFNVNAKQLQFQPQVISINDAVTDLNFTALP